MKGQCRAKQAWRIDIALLSYAADLSAMGRIFSSVGKGE
jgi:hypothetical protein